MTPETRRSDKQLRRDLRWAQEHLASTHNNPPGWIMRMPTVAHIRLVEEVLQLREIAGRQVAEP